MAHLTAADIAADLQISRAQAYRILREMLPLMIGQKAAQNRVIRLCCVLNLYPAPFFDAPYQEPP